MSPVLVLLALGIFEYGLVLRNSNVFANGLRSSARVASQSQNASNADLLTLQTLIANTSKMKSSVINKVVIYKSTAADGSVPAACLTASAAASRGIGGTSGVYCNVYQTADLTAANLVNANFNCTSSSSWDYDWCPTSREADLTDSPDYIGVWAQITYSGITGLLPGKTMTIKDKAVSRIEPTS